MNEFLFFFLPKTKREGKNDNDIVLEICNDIVKLLPAKILPVFSKGRHMDLKEALVNLKDKLGKHLFFLRKL